MLKTILILLSRERPRDLRVVVTTEGIWAKGIKVLGSKAGLVNHIKLRK